MIVDLEPEPMLLAFFEHAPVVHNFVLVYAKTMPMVIRILALIGFVIY